MKFTLDIPLGVIVPGQFQSLEAIREMTGALESAHVDACYVTDHPAPSAEWLQNGGLGHDALDPFSALSFVAASSTELMLHTNIVVLPYRNPFLTAKAAATLQVLSGGRLILGTAPGYQKGEFEELGVDFHTRGKLMDEALDTIRLAWAGGVVEKEGINFNARGNEPRPAPSPTPPIWIGGASEAAIKRAARAGDGWCPFFSDPRASAINQKNAVQSIEHLSETVARISELRSQQGRTGPFDVAIGPRARLKYGKPGGADAFLEELEQLTLAGATWLMVEPPHPSRQGYIENVQWFGEEVIGKF